MNPQHFESGDDQRQPDGVAPAARQDEGQAEETVSQDEGPGAELTASAPSLPTELPSTTRKHRVGIPSTLRAGDVIQDFEIRDVLGRGAAGVVYLAHQRSLNRRVALKVTRNVGSEARTMASLEHPHIVQVFSETVGVDRDMRLLCMQYVPGATLAAVLSQMSEMPRSRLSGAALVAAMDASSGGEVSLDADALQNRQRLAEADYVEAVCSIAARVADALHFAHQRGVLHRDIKPCNILIDPYGRPLLADFSLSFALLDQPDEGDEMFGGTLPYMAPEHLAAFNPASATTSEAVDERSDIFSLGVVLYEMLALRLPFETPLGAQLNPQTFDAMDRARSAPPAPLREQESEIPFALEHTICRCLRVAPTERYQNAGDLAESLDGCRMLETARRHLPPAGAVAQLVERSPLGASIALSFIPHLLGGVFSPAYGALVLFPRLTAQERTGFIWLAALYAAVIFPLLAAIVIGLFRPAARVWRRIGTDRFVAAEEVVSARQRLLSIPTWAVGLACLAWLLLLVIVPVGMRVISGGMSWAEFAHLSISVVMSLLIATTYSFFILQYIVVRLFYPRSWAEAAGITTTSRKELANVPARLRWFQICAGLVPLCGALLIVGLGPEAFDADSYLAFRLLSVALIVFGMAGIPLSIHVAALILRCIDALTRANVSDLSGHGR